MSKKLGQEKSNAIYAKYLILLNSNKYSSGQIQRMLCQEFGLKRATAFDHSVERFRKNNKEVSTILTLKKKPKVLVFDIETFANLSFTWGKWEQNVIDFEREWFVLCFCYKWLGEKTVHSVALPDFNLYKKDKFNDYEVILAMWKLFDEADIVLAHNGDKFDIKKMYSRFLYHKLPPPSPFKSIDTLKIARSKFALNSNKLDDIGRYLGIGRKMVHTGWDLWKRCSLGEDKAWQEMIAYNKQDVILLEKVYNAFLPYITNHPNLNLYSNTTHSCPNCGSKNIQKRGFAVTRVNKMQRYQCQDCAAWSQGTDKIVR